MTIILFWQNFCICSFHKVAKTLFSRSIFVCCNSPSNQCAFYLCIYFVRLKLQLTKWIRLVCVNRLHGVDVFFCNWNDLTIYFAMLIRFFSNTFFASICRMKPKVGLMSDREKTRKILVEKKKISNGNLFYAVQRFISTLISKWAEPIERENICNQ